VVLPIDVTVEDGVNGVSRKLDEIQKKDVIVDVGPKTRQSFYDLVKGKKFIVLNGPVGWYEKGYDKGTKKLLKILSDSKAKVIIGGGDTVALASKMHLGNTFHFTSTGGGAMLDYIIDGKLPGIEALKKNKK